MSSRESVWDYPRPPRLEPTSKRIEIEFGGVKIVETTRALRLLETSHPPSYYIPLEDVLKGVLKPVAGSSHCEWKGQAAYYDVVVGKSRAARAAFAYPEPVTAYAAIAGHVAFYARPMDVCRVDGEVVLPQEGDFYAGWITSELDGPFKGGAGTWGW